LATSGCGIAFPLDCFDGDCLPKKDSGAADVRPDTSPVMMDAAPEAEAGMDAAEDTGADVVVNPCKLMPDPCRNVTKPNGGCYCGTNTTGGFDHSSATPGCLYQCNDTTNSTQGAKLCPNGCSIEPTGVMDNCTGVAPTDYAHCLD
jgi:hypothetical protein